MGLLFASCRSKHAFLGLGIRRNIAMYRTIGTVNVQSATFKALPHQASRSRDEAASFHIGITCTHRCCRYSIDYFLINGIIDIVQALVWRQVAFVRQVIACV